MNQRPDRRAISRRRKATTLARPLLTFNVLLGSLALCSCLDSEQPLFSPSRFVDLDQTAYAYGGNDALLSNVLVRVSKSPPIYSFLTPPPEKEAEFGEMTKFLRDCMDSSKSIQCEPTDIADASKRILQLKNTQLQAGIVPLADKYLVFQFLEAERGLHELAIARIGQGTALGLTEDCNKEQLLDKFRITYKKKLTPKEAGGFSISTVVVKSPNEKVSEDFLLNCAETYIDTNHNNYFFRPIAWP